MNIDITPFIELLIGSTKDKVIPNSYYITLLITTLVFFVIRDFLLVKREELRENKNAKIADFIIEVIAAMGIGACCLYLLESVLIPTIFGILCAIYLTPFITLKVKKKKEKEEEKPSIENNVNVVINNNTDDEKEDFLPSFYDPDDLKLPENITSFNQLNIIMILEMYGYISRNQKFKMITQSLFETPDEQVEKLLEMYVLDERELKEARAILNLIRLNNRLISKEEALHYILEIENKKKENEKKGG